MLSFDRSCQVNKEGCFLLCFESLKSRCSALRMFLLLPSITRRLDDVLLVKELNAKFFDHCITERLLHTAVSAPSASVEFDYERLELLGKIFIKKIITMT